MSSEPRQQECCYISRSRLGQCGLCPRCRDPAANNFKVETVVDGGASSTATKRDTQPYERANKGLAAATALPAVNTSSSSLRNVKPWTPPPPHSRPSKRVKSAAVREKEQHEAGLRYLLAERAKRDRAYDRHEDASLGAEQAHKRARRSPLLD